MVAPATFNTTNKVTAGISDTLALGLVNGAIGMGKLGALKCSRRAGVCFVLDRAALPVPGSGRPGAATFPWAGVYSVFATATDEILASC